ncbi:FimB/Mfa2 family fimbrial subunit [Parabacteroides faecis]|uniref:Uncharacterized protein n=1 Tax=Parabacteroides faecis TaxID=1217282 RepID=A0ABR6KG11_9BACT|nr:FimB/Mfa2 family fimbrial subunit [Parabacteroides faecis]MBB4620446.1 hypothetical protein [Parabacteroides faecis]GGK04921.1 hypothetical protein GCM10007084_30190 [Parabacteroides faecis]
MKHNKLITKQTIFLALALVALFATSCIKDDLDGCPGLTLKVVNQDNEDVTPLGVVSSTTLYVFDENLKLLETRNLDETFIKNRQSIQLNYPLDTKLHLVAWGNLTKENQIVPDVKSAEDLNVMLNANNGEAQSPDSLFYGLKKLAIQAVGNQEIVIAPIVGQVSMKTEGLQYAIKKNPAFRSAKASGDASAYEFQLNRTLSGYNYKGEQIGDSVYYKPEGNWDETATEWITPQTTNVCYGNNLSSSFMDENGVIQTVNEYEYEDGTVGPIDVKVYENILIKFRWNDQGAFIGAKVIVTPWGVVEDTPDLKPKN